MSTQQHTPTAAEQKFLVFYDGEFGGVTVGNSGRAAVHQNADTHTAGNVAVQTWKEQDVFRACNSHEALAAVVRKLAAWAPDADPDWVQLSEIHDEARAALKLAKGAR